MIKNRRPRDAHTHALDRVLYLLEEQSFQNLAMDDERFASFIEQLYQRVETEQQTLSSHPAH
ncbi:MAG TPA: hypothetical protein VFH39_03260 [Candidatus Saccharimonadales bacterium]|nr:hypothetical protein [Candidatus Saccharimonadales bacterium]